MKTDYKKFTELADETKITVVLRLSERRSRDFPGLTYFQLKEAVRKYDPSMTDEKIDKALNKADYFGNLCYSVKSVGHNYERVIRVDRMEKSRIDRILEDDLGWIKVTEKILV